MKTKISVSCKTYEARRHRKLSPLRGNEYGFEIACKAYQEDEQADWGDSPNKINPCRESKDICPNCKTNKGFAEWKKHFQLDGNMNGMTPSEIAQEEESHLGIYGETRDTTLVRLEKAYLEAL